MVQYDKLIILCVAALVVFVVLLLMMSIRVVRQGYIYIVESFGKYFKTWEAGVHIKSPIGHRVVRKVCIKEQVADLPSQNAITEDNICLSVDVIIYFIITDPYKNVYGVENYLASLEKLSASALYDVSSGVKLEKFVSNKDEMGLDIQSKMSSCVEDWGVSIKRVELHNIMLPDTVREALEDRARAEREKDVKVLEAEGNRSATLIEAEAKKKKAILEAESLKETNIIEAEGKARAIEILREAEAKGIRYIKGAGVDSSTLSLYKIEAMKAIADSDSSKVYLPTELMKFLDEVPVGTKNIGRRTKTGKQKQNINEGITGADN